MYKLPILSCVTVLVLLGGLPTASAQDNDMLVIPVEMFACTYNDRKGPSDLDRVIAKWNTWADKQGIDDYSAWTLTPYYFGPGSNAGFDVVWMGAAKDAVALGKAQDKWLGNNAGLQAEFNNVISCDSHASFASVNYKAPPEGASPANSVITFSDCSYKDGASFSALSAAMAEWSQHQSDAGSTAGIWHWYPAYGGGGEDYSFKWLESFENLADLGGDFERFGNGGGFVTSGRLLNHLIECDSTRAYLAKNHRYVQLR